ncbi:MAG TPA: DUF3078 domain-containing protein [Parafilimonas sp.]|nr:DUF3078 domain-containing protein [Parafilimonas sp.]
MKKLFTLVCFLSPLYLLAQDTTIKNMQTEAGKTIAKDVNDTIPEKWKTGGILSLNVSQGSLSNWAAGGEKFSMALNTFVNLHAFYKQNKTSWDNNLDFYLGYVKTTSLGARKSDDRFDLTSKYGYALNSKWNVGGLFNLRSQFFKGYTYPDVNTKIYSSNFFAPAYMILSPGFDWHPVKNLSVFVSPATARWVIVKDTSLSKLYGVEPGEKGDFQLGAYLTINYMAALGKAVTYSGRLDLFSNYQHNPQNIDLYMTNLLAVKISNVLSFTYSLTLIYDDDVRLFGPSQTAPALQLQSLFGAGLLVKF